MSYAWSEGWPESHTLRIDADRPTWFVSDLHLGDGSHSDAFMGKDRALLRLLEQVRDEKARLVICGDAIDLLQARDLTPVIKAHGKLLRTLSDIAASERVIYIHGNHDHDIRVYRDLLRFEVCARLWIGPDIVVQHGHQFDPFIGSNLDHAGWLTGVHHAIEHVFGVWIRVPMADFYTPGNRLAFWAAHKAWLVLKARNAVFRRIGLAHVADRSQRFADYWARSEAGDPMSMLAPALAFAAQEGAKTVICGHAHMPANLVADGIRYINTGSWTFNWGQAVSLKDGVFTCQDQLTGRVYTDELYRPVLDGDLATLTFDRWWRSQYLGWFRFRTGELRRRYGSAS